jgi:hypothetical protein
MRTATVIVAFPVQVQAPVKSRPANVEHREIFEAVIARDAGRACMLLAQHIQRTTDALLENGTGPVRRGDRYRTDVKGPRSLRMRPRSIGTHSAGNVCTKSAPILRSRLEERLKETHCSCGQIVHQHDGPLASLDICDTPIDPTFVPFPIARCAVPEHDAVATSRQVIDRVSTEQTRSHIARAVGPEPSFRRGELAEQSLRLADFPIRQRWVRNGVAEQRRMGERVVADPMALAARARGQRHRARLQQLLPR